MTVIAERGTIAFAHVGDSKAALYVLGETEVRGREQGRDEMEQAVFCRRKQDREIV